MDLAGLVGADMRPTVGCELLQHHRGRHLHPATLQQGIPLAVFVEIGAGRAAIALDAVGGAVATGVARARLLQLLVPVVVLGVAVAMQVEVRATVL